MCRLNMNNSGYYRYDSTSLEVQDVINGSFYMIIPTSVTRTPAHKRARQLIISSVKPFASQ